VLAAFIFVLSKIVATHRVAADLKATTPVMLTPLAVIIGLLIAFLASRVWANLDHANAYLAHEAGAIRQSVMLADALPVDVRTPVRDAIKSYLQFAITKDWPAMAESRGTLDHPPPGLSDAMTALLSFQPATAGQQLAQQRAVISIEQALEARRDRIVLSQAAIAPSQWIAIIVLTALVFSTIAKVHIDRPVTVAVNLFIFSTAVAACLVLLLINDRPFAAGGYTLQPDLLRQIEVD
jgi:Protein of unknown function (DUF4239)